MSVHCWRPDPQALETDAFSMNWKGLKAYANPPPPLALDQSSFMSSQGTSGNHCAGGTGVENPSLVFPTVGVADRDTPQTSQDKEPDSANTPSQLPRHPTPPCRVAYLRARFSVERISPQASNLLLASWREKSGRTYDSLFGKWASWCVERDIDPISGDITGVVNFLADLFHQGYQHRSLCSYRLAISSVHEKVDGQPRLTSDGAQASERCLSRETSTTPLFSKMGRIGGYKPYRVPGRQPEPGFRRPDAEACDVSGTDKAIQIDGLDKSGHPFQTLKPWRSYLPVGKAGKAISSDKACSGLLLSQVRTEQETLPRLDSARVREENDR